MFEFAGYIFTVSEVITAILGLLAINPLLTLALLLKGHPMQSAVSEKLREAVVSLDQVANSLASAVEDLRTKVLAGSANDDDEVLASVNRINSIAEALRGQVSKLKE
jgi:hypothetical protein